MTTNNEKPEIDVLGYINPTWEIEIKDADGKQVVKMPFCFMVHQYLKMYGFDPDAKLLNPSADIILRIAPGSEAKLPLFIQSREEAEKGMNGKGSI
jgi:hypothetical protein